MRHGLLWEAMKVLSAAGRCRHATALLRSGSGWRRLIDAGLLRRQWPSLRGAVSAGSARKPYCAGRGNNGGDGMMTAWLLAECGLEGDDSAAGRAGGVEGRCAGSVAGVSNHPQGRRGEDPRGDGDGRPGAAEGGLDTDLILDAGGGTGFKPPLKGAGAGGAEVDEGEQGAGAFCRFAFGVGGGMRLRLARRRRHSTPRTKARPRGPRCSTPQTRTRLWGPRFFLPIGDYFYCAPNLRMFLRN